MSILPFILRIKSRIPFPSFCFELHVLTCAWNQLLNIYVIKQEFLLLNLVVKDKTHLRHLETTMWPLYSLFLYLMSLEKKVTWVKVAIFHTRLNW